MKTSFAHVVSMVGWALDADKPIGRMRTCFKPGNGKVESWNANVEGAEAFGRRLRIAAPGVELCDGTGISPAGRRKLKFTHWSSSRLYYYLFIKLIAVSSSSRQSRFWMPPLNRGHLASPLHLQRAEGPCGYPVAQLPWKGHRPTPRIFAGHALLGWRASLIAQAFRSPSLGAGFPEHQERISLRAKPKIRKSDPSTDTQRNDFA